MPTNWLPESVTSLAKQTDSLFVLIFGIALVVFVLVEFLLIFFLLKYKRSKRNQEGLAVHGNTRLEIIWTLIPALILVGLGIYSTQMTYNIQKASAADAYEIEVIGRKWSWEFKYPNGASTINDLRIPEGKNVVLKITSADVIHSLWLPEARIKQDAVPGRQTIIPLGPLKPGTYRVICAEYCGTAHTKMLATMKTEPQPEFEKFLADAKKASEEGPQAGQKLAMQNCLSCHSTDGSKSAGPSWKGLYGSQQKLTNGSTVKVDDEFIKKVLEDPTANVPEGYSPSMPSFKGKLDEKQIKSIIEFIKTLQ
ncbi:cytochrome c oxidase subunit II [Effusibacillus pohliae]|uniref:cytochrome c oxidase subunit II n=1 Tax=Effusibacillus pohliae TaxID=232270 RepID=UPI0003751FCB|nr:cytochrome c oxidase subunit II [Effusibacillus pohliae]